MLIYATPTDLVDNGWITADQVPANVTALLRQASVMVRFATRTDRYYTYPVPAGTPLPTSAPAGMEAGKPRDPADSRAFNDAVCQQVVFWAEAKVNPDSGLAGLGPVVSAETVPGGSVTYEVAMTQQWQQEAVEGLCEAAVLILRNAGLCINRPNVL